MNILSSLRRNKNTTGAAVAFGFIELVYQLGSIWFPEAQPKLKLTCDAFQKYALMFGLFASSDASQHLSPQLPAIIEEERRRKKALLQKDV